MKSFLGFKRGVRHNFFYLACVELLGCMCFYYPVAVLLYQAATGSYALAMAVFSANYVVQVVAEIPTGIWSDKVGRRKTLVAGLILEIIGTVLYASAFSPIVGGAGFFGGAIVFGIANALYSGNNTALWYESLSYYRKRKEVPKFFGRMMSMQQAGLAFSGGIAIVLLGVGGNFQMLVIASIPPLFLALLAALLVVEPPRRQNAEKKELPSLLHFCEAMRLIWENRRLRSLTLAKSWGFGVGQMSHNLMPGFIDLVWPTWLTPLYRMGQNFVGMVSFWFSGRMIRRFGAIAALVGAWGGSFVVKMTALLLAAPLSPVLLWLNQVTYAVNENATGTVEQENFSDAQRSTMGSIISVLGAVFAAVIGVALGGLADAVGVVNALIILTCAGLPSLFIYTRLFWRDKQENDTAA